MKLRTAIRKTVKWGGAVVVVLLVAVWVASGWWALEWVKSSGWFVDVCGGRIGVTKGDIALAQEALSVPNGFFWRPLSGGPFYEWSFNYGEAGVFDNDTCIVFPIWFPALLVLLPTALAWRADRRAFRRARIGLCPACGYDRRGLAAGSVCPECGAAAKAGAAS